MDNDTYVKTYISKFEGVFLDQVRKHVECDTKNALYASAVQDFQKKLEEAERNSADTKSALDQALNGLQAVTLEKNEMKIKLEKLESDFSLVSKESDKLKLECMQVQNKLAISEQTITELTEKLNSQLSNNDTLKNNYQIVLNELQEYHKKQHQIDSDTDVNPKRKKKTDLTKGPDWVDGDEI
jgi:chromosome segregation ATPase